MRRVCLRLTVDNLCSEDQLEIELNGHSLGLGQGQTDGAGAVTVLRGYGVHIAAWEFDASSSNLALLAGNDREAGGWAKRTATRAPDSGGPGLAMALEVELRSTDVRPRRGTNHLGLCLARRPEGLAGGVIVHSVSVEVDYGSRYPAGTGAPSKM